MYLGAHNGLHSNDVSTNRSILIRILSCISKPTPNVIETKNKLQCIKKGLLVIAKEFILGFLRG